MRLAAVDIGGTAVKYGVFNEKGNEIAYKECATRSEYIMDDMIKELKEFVPFDAIGISTAGLIDSANGIVVEGSVNIPGMDGLKVKEILEGEFTVPVIVENDVNAAALAENTFGSGKDLENFLFLTYGTGVGGAIINNSELFYGISGFAGEFGHVVIHGGGIPCKCGMTGCYERYASTSALVKTATKIDPAYNNGRIIFEEFYKGNKEITEAVNQWTDEISIGLASLVHIFNPPAIIVGGGIMEQDVLIEMIQERVNRMVFKSFKEIKIMKATIGNKSGILGAISQHINK